MVGCSTELGPGSDRAYRRNLTLALGLLAGRSRPEKPASIFPTSIVPVPLVTTGSRAAKARN
jgi:hypothetical protein